MELSQQGFCCSQSIVQMGLDAMGKHDADLIRAMGGLCGGLGKGEKVCGALSGAACLLSLYTGKGSPDEKEHEETREMLIALQDWFDEEYGKKYGGTACLAILEGKAENRPARCPQIVLETYRKTQELLASAGISMKDGKEEEPW